MSVLSGKVVIVTGASSGIGEATALELAKHNVKVVVAARRAERLESLVERILGAGGHAQAAACDVTDKAQVDRVAQTALDTFGQIDAIVNNAGVMPLSNMAECRTEDWDSMVDVNVKGVLYGVASVLPHMLERGEGHLINVSSIAGRRVFPGGAVYCGTKFAVHAISEGLRSELATKNIRVTIIAPGIVQTELQGHIASDDIAMRMKAAMKTMTPLTSEDIAHSIVYAMQAPAHVNINEILVRPTKQEG